MSTVKSLHQQFRSQATPVTGQAKIHFHGVDGEDVYNLTAPFRAGRISVIAARVEPRDSECSRVMFFDFDSHQRCDLLPDAPVLALQDPFFTHIGEQLIFGGVAVTPDPKNPAVLRWKTVLYRGADIHSLSPFFTGPEGMKDIRLVELQEGRVLVFTRPQGAVGGRGTIGYVVLNTLDELTSDALEQATLLYGQVSADEWCGVNAAYRLDAHDIGVLSHIARFDAQGHRHYYACTFVFNSQTHHCSPMKMIAERQQFELGPAKRADLNDVIFPGGLTFVDKSSARLYCGTSDCEAQWIDINYPF
ncbi:hypothetical protein AwEntero_01900 [Enterobacterales bacterium]|nr:hypothetical protein AwEntero_01900 [Enterobacterales bacterium]